jgi:UDP-N-acetylglucosamine/UDP-N-acetylgalactosamine diphosphorylase
MVTADIKNSNCQKKTESSIKQVKKFKGEQGQLFKFELTEGEFEDLESQLKDLPEPSVLKDMFQKAMKMDSKLKNSKESKLKPVDDELIMVSQRGSEQWSQWHKIGLEALRKGECSIVTLAGGQGTRLGSSAPKGCYRIGLPSGSSLFQIQAERVLKIQKLACMKLPLSWYIMTSAPTHEATVDFFEKSNYFGLNVDQVKFFQQGVLPAFDMEGNILMSGRGKVSVAPDGNGGIYKALQREGILEEMKSKGIKYVHMYCVDNCLVKVGDPAFIGACINSSADCAAKCVEKTEPSESVGVFCKNVNDNLVVAEYSELDAESAQAVDAKTGRLIFGEANIANHFFTVEFLDKITEKLSLPYHVARKKIPTINPNTGEMGTTAGVKLEAFIFDVFELADKPKLFRVPRFEEFAPLKNAPGAPKDSPEYCTDLLLSLHRKYLQEAGAIVDDNGKYELIASLTYEGEGLEYFKGKEIKKSDMPTILK